MAMAAETMIDVLIELEHNAERGAEGRQNGGAPKNLADERRQKQCGGDSSPISLLKGIEQRRIAGAPHDAREHQSTDDQAQRISPRSLSPNQPPSVSRLGRAVDISATNPSGGHRKHADPKRHLSPGDDQPARVSTRMPPSRHHANDQHQDIKQTDTNDGGNRADHSVPGKVCEKRKGTLY